MSYIVVFVAAVAALAIWWMASSREFAATQAKLRKSKAAERARFSREDPGAEAATAAKRQQKRKRSFGYR